MNVMAGFKERLLILKNYKTLVDNCKSIYFEEIEKWEKENGYSWGDFGFSQGGVSLLQQ